MARRATKLEEKPGAVRRSLTDQEIDYISSRLMVAAKTKKADYNIMTNDLVLIRELQEIKKCPQQSESNSASSKEK